MSNEPRADLIWRNSWGFARTCVLAAAVEVKLFDAFADGPADAAELARRTGCSPRGVAALAGALVGMELLTRDGDCRFAPTPAARFYLGPNPQADLGPTILHSMQLMTRWQRLAESVRTGSPPPREPAAPPAAPPAQAAKPGNMFVDLTRRLFNGNYLNGQVLCRTLAARDKFSPVAVLDIGAGAAPWSIPFAQANPACRVTVIDYPDVLPVARREHAARFGVAQRYCCRGEPAEAADLGREQFDLVLIGHVYHSMGPAASADLARRCGAALRRGGVLAVAEFVVNEDRLGPLHSLLFACNMLLGAPDGGTFTGTEIDDWARAAGLTPIVPIEIPNGSPVRVARKL